MGAPYATKAAETPSPWTQYLPSSSGLGALWLLLLPPPLPPTADDANGSSEASSHVGFMV